MANLGRTRNISSPGKSLGSFKALKAADIFDAKPQDSGATTITVAGQKLVFDTVTSSRSRALAAANRSRKAGIFAAVIAFNADGKGKKDFAVYLRRR